MVAFDGPYKGLSSEPHSPLDNWDVFTGYPYGIYMRLGSVWESEAAKRTAVARTAYKNFYPAVDRLLIIDGDEELLSDIPDGPIVVGKWSNGPTTSKMIRVMPLTSTITWGPQHWHIEDEEVMYHETPEEEFDSYPTFDMAHHLGAKRIQDAYDRYNVDMRPSVEFDRNKISEGDANRLFGNERRIIGKATTEAKTK